MTSIKTISNKQYALLICLLLIMTALTAPTLNDSYWLDESINLRQSMQTPSETVGWLYNNDVHTPLYHVLLNYWMQANQATNEAVTRTLSLIISVITIITFFKYTMRFYDEAVALTTTVFLTTSETMLHYSVEVRPYSLLILLAVLSTYTYRCWLAEHSRTYIFWYAITLTLLTYTHLFGLLLLASHVAHYVLTQRNNSFHISTGDLELAAAYLFTIIMFLPWAVNLASQIQGGNLSWIPSLTPLLLWNTYQLLFASPHILLIFIAILPLTWKTTTTHTLTISWATIPLVITAVYSLTVQPALNQRYLLFTLPALYLLLSDAIHSIPNKWIRRAAITTTLILFVASSTYPNHYQRTDWKKAAQHTGADQPILIHPPFEQESITYYLNPRCHPITNTTKLAACNSDDEIYSVQPNTTCCNNTTELETIDKKLNTLTDQEFQIIHHNLSPNTPIKDYLEETGNLKLHQELPDTGYKDPRVPYFDNNVLIYNYTPTSSTPNQ